MKRPPSRLTQPALKLIVRSFLRRLGEEQRAHRVRVNFNRRMRTAIGRSDPAGGRIYLNPRLLDRYPHELVPTLVHELCHVVAGLRAGHGPRWKDLMERLGYRPDTYHDLDVEDVAVIRRTWRWRCRGCGESYLRKSRRADAYRCGACGGALHAAPPERRAAREARPVRRESAPSRPRRKH
jgi:predicted SprT family Zn-dependent metalloprotease